MGCGLPAAGSGGSRTRCGGGVVAAPRCPRARRQPRSVHRESTGVTFLNFCWNFNRRRGALRPDAPAERSPRRMLLASVSYRTLAHKLRSQRHFTASVRPVRLGASVLDCFCGDWSPSKALRRAKPSPGAHSSAEAASGSTLPAARSRIGPAPPAAAGPRASPLTRDKKRVSINKRAAGPWPRTSTIR